MSDAEVQRTAPFPEGEPFVLIGQPMADGNGVVVLVGKPIHDVHMRESMSRGGKAVLLSADLEPGYTKIFARNYQHAFEQMSNT